MSGALCVRVRDSRALRIGLVELSRSVRDRAMGIESSGSVDLGSSLRAVDQKGLQWGNPRDDDKTSGLAAGTGVEERG